MKGGHLFELRLNRCPAQETSGAAYELKGMATGNKKTKDKASKTFLILPPFGIFSLNSHDQPAPSPLGRGETRVRAG